MLYKTGERIFLGDAVTHGGMSGKVVFIIEEGEFEPPYRKEEWTYLEKGIGVLWDDDELLILDEPTEELVLLAQHASHDP